MDNQIENHFDKIACEYDEEIPKHIRTHLLHKKTKLMFKMLSDRSDLKGSKGIDIGCGTGWYIREFCNKGYEMVGLDFSVEMIKMAKRNNKDSTIKPRFVAGNGVQLPFKNSSFDFAYIINMLHHLQSKEEQLFAIKEIGRVLKNGGLLFIHEINTGNLVFNL